VVSKLRESGIASEIYPDQAKIKKQLDYSNKKMIPFTIVIGSDEIKTGELAFKDMNKGEQVKLTIEQIIKVIR
jgi:histidyl-tRNA synthetase